MLQEEVTPGFVCKDSSIPSLLFPVLAGPHSSQSSVLDESVLSKVAEDDDDDDDDVVLL